MNDWVSEGVRVSERMSGLVSEGTGWQLSGWVGELVDLVYRHMSEWAGE